MRSTPPRSSAIPPERHDLDAVDHAVLPRGGSRRAFRAPWPTADISSDRERLPELGAERPRRQNTADGNREVGGRGASTVTAASPTISATAPTSRDDGEPACHRFDDRERESLVRGRVDEEVRGAVDGQDRRARAILPSIWTTLSEMSKRATAPPAADRGCSAREQELVRDPVLMPHRERRDRGPGCFAVAIALPRRGRTGGRHRSSAAASLRRISWSSTGPKRRRRPRRRCRSSWT